MNAEDQLLLQIDRYLRDDMDNGERTSFESQINGDAGLKTKVEEFRLLDSLLTTDIFRFKQRLDAVEEELVKENFFSGLDGQRSSRETSIRKPTFESAPRPQSEPGQVIRMKYAWAAAAAVALLFGAFWFFNRPPDVRQMAMNYTKENYEATRSSPVTRGGSLSTVTDTLNALFAAGEYDRYISKASAMLYDSLSHNDMSDLITGIANCWIMLGQPHQAINSLEKLDHTNLSGCAATFIYGLALLQEGNKADAKSYFNAVIENKKGCYPLDNKAKELLGKLN